MATKGEQATIEKPAAEAPKLTRNAWATGRAQAVMLAAHYLTTINADLERRFPGPSKRELRDVCRSEIARALKHAGETLDMGTP